jgi:hypothetical protein
MITIGALSSLFIVAILLGKHIHRPKPTTYFYIALLALAQACIVLYQMYSIIIPTK